MEDRIRLGKEIARLRKEAGISQVKLAELSGVGFSYIARIELGTNSVGVDTLSKIVSVFDMEITFAKK